MYILTGGREGNYGGNSSYISFELVGPMSFAFYLSTNKSNDSVLHINSTPLNRKDLARSGDNNSSVYFPFEDKLNALKNFNRILVGIQQEGEILIDFSTFKELLQDTINNRKDE